MADIQDNCTEQRRTAEGSHQRFSARYFANRDDVKNACFLFHQMNDLRSFLISLHMKKGIMQRSHG